MSSRSACSCRFTPCRTRCHIGRSSGPYTRGHCLRCGTLRGKRELRYVRGFWSDGCPTSTGPSDHNAEAEQTNDFLGIGSMERQHPRRDDVCLLRRPSIHRISSYNPGAGAIGSVPTPAIRRILRLWCRSRRNRNCDNIPARPAPHTLCCTGHRTNLSIIGIVGARDRATRRALRIFPGMLSGRGAGCTIHGIVLHSIRELPTNNG